MLGEVKGKLEEMGGTVKIHQNQGRNGQLGDPWINAEWRVSPGSEFSLLDNIKAAVPGFHSITVRYCASFKNVEVVLSFFPETREEWPIQDVKIIGCWVPCPVVSG